jgi:hypothetical protein
MRFRDELRSRPCTAVRFVNPVGRCLNGRATTVGFVPASSALGNDIEPLVAAKHPEMALMGIAEIC